MGFGQYKDRLLVAAFALYGIQIDQAWLIADSGIMPFVRNSPEGPQYVFEEPCALREGQIRGIKLPPSEFVKGIKTLLGEAFGPTVKASGTQCMGPISACLAGNMAVE